MPKLREVVATTATIGTLGMGVGAYKAHESADDIRTTATATEATYRDSVPKAELKATTEQLEGLAHTKDLQAIFLLGGAVLLGAGTAAGYRATAPMKKIKPTASHK